MERRFRKIFVVFVLLIVSSIMLTSCSHSDHHNSDPAARDEQANNDQQGDENQSEEDNGEQPPVGPEMLDLYNFTLSINTTDPFLTLSQPIPGSQGDRTLQVRTSRDNPITGTYDTQTRQVTFNDGSTFRVVLSNFWGEMTDTDFSILVENPIVFQDGLPGVQDDFPTQGSLSLFYDGNKVNAAFVNNDGNVGINMSRNDGETVFYDFDAFEDLVDGNIYPWQQKTCLAFFVLEELAEQAIFVARTTDTINARADVLESSGSVSFDCGTFPENSSDESSRTLTWIDSDNNDLLGAGDSFRWNFVQCWDNAEEGIIDDLMNGQVDLVGFIKDTEQRDSVDVMTQFGFGPEQVSTGGVIFTDLVHTEIEEETEGAFSSEPRRSFTINGGYTILFTES